MRIILLVVFYIATNVARIADGDTVTTMPGNSMRHIFKQKSRTARGKIPEISIDGEVTNRELSRRINRRSRQSLLANRIDDFSKNRKILDNNLERVRRSLRKEKKRVENLDSKIEHRQNDFKNDDDTDKEDILSNVARLQGVPIWQVPESTIDTISLDSITKPMITHAKMTNRLSFKKSPLQLRNSNSDRFLNEAILPIHPNSQELFNTNISNKNLIFFKIPNSKIRIKSNSNVRSPVFKRLNDKILLPVYPSGRFAATNLPNFRQPQRFHWRYSKYQENSSSPRNVKEELPNNHLTSSKRRFLLVPISKDFYVLKNFQDSPRINTDGKIIPKQYKLSEKNKNNATSAILSFKAHIHHDVKDVGKAYLRKGSNKHLSDHNANYLYPDLDFRVSKENANPRKDSMPLSYPNFLYPGIAFRTHHNLIDLTSTEISKEQNRVLDYGNIPSAGRDINLNAKTDSYDSLLSTYSSLEMPDYDGILYREENANNRQLNIFSTMKFDETSQFRPDSRNYKNFLEYGTLGVELTTMDFQNAFYKLEDNVATSATLKNDGIYSSDDDKEIFDISQSVQDDSKFTIGKNEDEDTTDFMDNISTQYKSVFGASVDEDNIFFSNTTYSSYPFIKNDENVLNNQDVNEDNQRISFPSNNETLNLSNNFNYDNKFIDEAMFSDYTTGLDSFLNTEDYTTSASLLSDTDEWSLKKTQSNIENQHSILMAIKPLSSDLQKLLSAVKLVNQSISNVQNRLCDKKKVRSTRIERESKDKKATNIAKSINNIKFKRKTKNYSPFLNKLTTQLHKRESSVSNPEKQSGRENFLKKTKLKKRNFSKSNNVKRRKLPHLRFNRNLKSLKKKSRTITPVITFSHLIKSNVLIKNKFFNGRAQNFPRNNISTKDNRAHFLLNNKRDLAQQNVTTIMPKEMHNPYDYEEKPFFLVDPQSHKEITAYFNILALLNMTQKPNGFTQITQYVTEPTSLLITRTTEFSITTTFLPYFIEEPTTIVLGTTITEKEELPDVTESVLYEYITSTDFEYYKYGEDYEERNYTGMYEDYEYGDQGNVTSWYEYVEETTTEETMMEVSTILPESIFDERTKGVELTITKLDYYIEIETSTETLIQYTIEYPFTISGLITTIESEITFEILETMSITQLPVTFSTFAITMPITLPIIYTTESPVLPFPIDEVAILTTEITTEEIATILTIAIPTEVTETFITIPTIEKFTTESAILLTIFLEDMTDITLNITIPAVTKTSIEKIPVLITETVTTEEEIMESISTTFATGITQSFLIETSTYTPYEFSTTPLFMTTETKSTVQFTTPMVPVLTSLIITKEPQKTTTQKQTTSVAETIKTIFTEGTIIETIPEELKTASTKILTQISTTTEITISITKGFYTTTDIFAGMLIEPKTTAAISIEKTSTYVTTVTSALTTQLASTTHVTESTIETSTTPTITSEVTTINYTTTTIASSPTISETTEIVITTLIPEKESPVTQIEKTITAEETMTTKSPITTKIPTTTEIPITTETSMPVKTQTTKIPRTTETITTKTLTPTKILTTIKTLKTTEISTTVGITTLTKILTSTGIPKTTETPTTTKIISTSGRPTTSKTMLTTKAVTSTKTSTPTKILTTVKIPTTRATPTPTEISTITKIPTTIKITSIETPTSTKTPETTKSSTITEIPTTEIQATTITSTITEVPTTIEITTFTEILTSTIMPKTTETPTTTKIISTSAIPTTSKTISTTKAVTSTKTSTPTKFLTTVKIPTTRATPTPTEISTITKIPTTIKITSIETPTSTKTPETTKSSTITEIPITIKTTFIETSIPTKTPKTTKSSTITKIPTTEIQATTITSTITEVPTTIEITTFTEILTSTIMPKTTETPTTKIISISGTPTTSKTMSTTKTVTSIKTSVPTKILTTVKIPTTIATSTPIKTPTITKIPTTIKTTSIKTLIPTKTPKIIETSITEVITLTETQTSTETSTIKIPTTIETTITKILTTTETSGIPTLTEISTSSEISTKSETSTITKTITTTKSVTPTEILTTITVLTTTETPTITENLTITESVATTESLTITEIPVTTESLMTTEIPVTTKSLTTTEIPTAESLTTTKISITTESLTTTEIPTTTKSLTTIESLATTESLMTTESLTTTEIPTTTKSLTTTEIPTTTKSLTTTESLATTESLMTTESLTTTKISITTESLTTTEIPTTTKSLTTTESLATTESLITIESLTTTEIPTTTKSLTTTESLATTESLMTTEILTTTESLTTIKTPATTKNLTTTKTSAITESLMTTKIPTTTESLTTTETSATTESLTSIKIPITTESMTTTKIPATTESLTSTKIPITTKSMTTTEISATSESLTTTKTPTTTESLTTTKTSATTLSTTTFLPEISESTTTSVISSTSTISSLKTETIEYEGTEEMLEAETEYYIAKEPLYEDICDNYEECDTDIPTNRWYDYEEYEITTKKTTTLALSTIKYTKLLEEKTASPSFYKETTASSYETKISEFTTYSTISEIASTHTGMIVTATTSRIPYTYTEKELTSTSTLKTTALTIVENVTTVEEKTRSITPTSSKEESTTMISTFGTFEEYFLPLTTVFEIISKPLPLEYPTISPKYTESSTESTSEFLTQTKSEKTPEIELKNITTLEKLTSFFVSPILTTLTEEEVFKIGMTTTSTAPLEIKTEPIAIETSYEVTTWSTATLPITKEEIVLYVPSSKGTTEFTTTEIVGREQLKEQLLQQLDDLEQREKEIIEREEKLKEKEQKLDEEKKKHKEKYLEEKVKNITLVTTSPTEGYVTTTITNMTTTFISTDIISEEVFTASITTEIEVTSPTFDTSITTSLSSTLIEITTISTETTPFYTTEESTSVTFTAKETEEITTEESTSTIYIIEKTEETTIFYPIEESTFSTSITYITEETYTTSNVTIYSEPFFTSSTLAFISTITSIIDKFTTLPITTLSERFDEIYITSVTTPTSYSTEYSTEETYTTAYTESSISSKSIFTSPTLELTSTTLTTKFLAVSTITEIEYDEEIESLKEKLRNKERELKEREKILLEREKKLEKDIMEFKKYVEEFKKKEMETLIALTEKSTKLSTPVPPTEKITTKTQVLVTEKKENRTTTKIVTSRHETTKIKEQTKYVSERDITQEEKEEEEEEKEEEEEIVTKRICLNVLENTTIPIDEKKRDIATKRVCLPYIPEKNEENKPIGRLSRNLLALKSMKEIREPKLNFLSNSRYRRRRKIKEITHKISNLQLSHHEWLNSGITKPLRHFKGFTRIYQKTRKPFLRNVATINNIQENTTHNFHGRSLYNCRVLDHHKNFFQSTISTLSAKECRKRNIFSGHNLIPERRNSFFNNDKVSIEKRDVLSIKKSNQSWSTKSTTSVSNQNATIATIEKKKSYKDENEFYTVNVLRLKYNKDKEMHELISAKPDDDELTVITPESKVNNYVADKITMPYYELEEKDDLKEEDDELSEEKMEEKDDYFEDMVENYMNYEERETPALIQNEKFTDNKYENERTTENQMELLQQTWPTEKSMTYHLGGTRYWELDFGITEPSDVFSTRTDKSKTVHVSITKTTCFHIILKNGRNNDAKIKHNISYRHVYNNSTRKYNASIGNRDSSFKNVTRKNILHYKLRTKEPSVVQKELKRNSQKLKWGLKYYKQNVDRKRMANLNEFSTPVFITSNKNAIIATNRKLCGVHEKKQKHQIIKHKNTINIQNTNKKKQLTKSERSPNVNLHFLKDCTDSCITNKKNSDKYHEIIITKTTANHYSQIKNSDNKKNDVKTVHPNIIANHKNKSISQKIKMDDCLNCICDTIDVINTIRSILDRISFPLDEIKALNCSRYKETQDKIVISMDSDMEETKAFPQPHYNTELLKGQKYIKLEELEDDFKNDLEFDNDHDIISFPGLNLNLPCNQDGDDITWLSSISRPSYTWKRTDGVALLGFVAENGDLELRNVNAKDTGNYTCVMTYMGPDNEEPVENTYEIYLQIVTLPRYIVHGESRYHIRSCDERDLDVLVTYLSPKLNSIICEADICNVYVLTPSCSRSQITINILIVPSYIFKLMTVDHKRCNVFCLKAIQDKLSLILSRNLQIFLGKTIIFRLPHYEQKLAPIVEKSSFARWKRGRIGRNTFGGSNIGMFSSCPAGYGLRGTHCVPCNMGTYSEDGISHCKKCPPGTYQPNYGARICRTCTNPLTKDCYNMLWNSFSAVMVTLASLGVMLSIFLLLLWIICCAKKKFCMKEMGSIISKEDTFRHKEHVEEQPLIKDGRENQDQQWDSEYKVKKKKGKFYVNKRRRKQSERKYEKTNPHEDEWGSHRVKNTPIICPDSYRSHDDYNNHYPNQSYRKGPLLPECDFDT